MKYKYPRARKFIKKFHKGATTLATAINTANTAYRIAKGVSSLVNAEHKWYDYSSSNQTGLSYVGTVKNLVQPPQAVDANSRTGDSIRLTSLQVNMNFINPTTVTFGSSTDNESFQIRYAILKWHDERTYVPTGSAYNKHDGNTQCIIGLKQLHPNQGRYTVLVDRTFTLNSADWYSGKMIHHRFKFKGKRGHIEFSPTSTSIDSGGYYLMIWALAGGVGSGATVNSLEYSVTARARYLDN